MLLHVFVLAALSSCDRYEAPIRSAEAFFASADGAFSRHEVAAGRASYDAGMQQIANTPWYIEDKACDPPHYTLEKQVAVLHSLRIAQANGIMESFDAYQNMYKMNVWKPFARAITVFLYRQYPDLMQQVWGYTEAIRTAARTERIQAHDPSGPGCRWSDLDVDAFTVVTPDYPNAARGDLSGAADVLVNVDVAANGNVTGASVQKSSGDVILDQAAVSAARTSTYLPKVSNCQRVPGVYQFTATFDPNG